MKDEGIEACDVLVPCGGGRLTSGIALALREAAPRFLVRTCEPENYDDTARSLALGERVNNRCDAPSICDAIVTAKPGELTFPIIRRLCAEGFVVSEDQVRETMRLALNHLKLVIEPGGAVALAAALFQNQSAGNESVVVVASGGNVDLELIRQIAQ